MSTVSEHRMECGEDIGKVNLPKWEKSHPFLAGLLLNKLQTVTGKMDFFQW
ncbi:hypothetical protein LCD38_03485 [Bacillus sp. RAR_GA_16]|nr:hypothetical protein [Bacillus sp. RAR_GA_16]